MRWRPPGPVALSPGMADAWVLTRRPAAWQRFPGRRPRAACSPPGRRQAWPDWAWRDRPLPDWPGQDRAWPNLAWPDLACLDPGWLDRGRLDPGRLVLGRLDMARLDKARPRPASSSRTPRSGGASRSSPST